MMQEFTYRKAEKADLPRVSQFYKAFWDAHETGRSCEPEYYEWKTFNNPFLPGEIYLAEDGDKVVGMKSMTPKRMKVLGSEVAGGETGDTFTHPEYQRRGIFTSLFAAAKRDKALDTRLDYIFGLPGKVSLLGYERKLDYSQVPVNVRGQVLLLDPEPVLKTKLPAFLANIISPVARGFSYLAFKIGTHGVKNSISVANLSAFPDDIDTVWEKVMSNYDVAMIRDKTYLTWRYVNSPDKYSILAARDLNDKILGYIVTKFHSGNLPIGYLCDFLTTENDPNIFRALLSAAVADFNKKQAALVMAFGVGGSHYVRLLRKAGFLPLARHVIISYNNEMGKRVLNSRCRWHFTMGDSDHV